MSRSRVPVKRLLPAMVGILQEKAPSSDTLSSKRGTDGESQIFNSATPMSTNGCLGGG